MFFGLATSNVLCYCWGTCTPTTVLAQDGVVTASSMREFQTHTVKEASTVTELMPSQPQITIRPMTDEEAERMGKVLKEAKELRKRILARRKGKPLPSSWRLIRQARDERSRHI